MQRKDGIERDGDGEGPAKKKEKHDEALIPPVADDAALPPPAAAAGADVGWDLDAGMAVEEKKEGPEVHDIQWEVAHWFIDAPALLWKESPPYVTWPGLKATFPRISLLARRFLCILPTSAASERVWSGFGHVIDKSATNIDSDAACRTMYLRYNHDSVDKVPLF